MLETIIVFFIGGEDLGQKTESMLMDWSKLAVHHSADEEAGGRLRPDIGHRLADDVNRNKVDIDIAPVASGSTTPTISRAVSNQAEFR